MQFFHGCERLRQPEIASAVVVAAQPDLAVAWYVNSTLPHS
jgi:hypothetical protein